MKISSIGVLCSGGDAPGMNAALRAVVRYGLAQGLKVYGIRKGYRGLIQGQWDSMDERSVANIILRGGTILKTDRCLEFHKKKWRKIAAEQARIASIDALIVIGGDGSFRGAHALWTEWKLPVIGIPATIDNDIAGTEETLGFDTAVNNALDAIDKIRDTASAHERTFLIEVMGRNSGHIAMDVGIGAGAEAILIPEVNWSVAHLASRIQAGISKGKMSSIIVVAEGKEPGCSMQLAKVLKQKYDLEAKVCILGHLQRGGAPTARDRLLGSIFGVQAVQALIQGKTDKMVGIVKGREVLVPFQNKQKNQVRKEWLSMVEVLAN